ncbi:nucleotidyltransferase family protein [Aquisalimonas asiatica]|uniref:nucleotidyltransferase family protein n=1 Tax=Aquisalimonas asiatica TaxID=406100 RepID=UPI001C0DBBDB|nr:nucleotidyltransferase family protein [Aquisalimonas asiatica]
MEMSFYATIVRWISEDPMRMDALESARSLNMPDWCLAAGFVRNLLWDRLHGFEQTTSLNDIDLIYFDDLNTDKNIDRALEYRLRTKDSLPWSVKNQARMHTRNSDGPYSSTEDAMSYWVEVETAVGAALSNNGQIRIVAPFGVDQLFQYSITPNPKRLKMEQFEQRIRKKGWLQTWPELAVNHSK